MSIPEPSAPKIDVTLPESGEPVHIICEVRDDGPYTLVAYRRIIISY